MSTHYYKGIYLILKSTPLPHDIKQYRRTINPMDRNEVVNAQLLSALAPFISNKAISDLVTVTLGTDMESLQDGASWPIASFYLKAETEVFALYAVSPGKFMLGEINTNGRMLNVTIPLDRIRRIVTDLTVGQMILLIEVDADQSTYRETNDNGIKSYRHLPAGYEIVVGEADVPALLNFANGLRNVIGL